MSTQQPSNHQAIIDRFVAVCQADNRIVAAFLGGSSAKGTTDEYSDLDLGLITTDEAYEGFSDEREAFARLLGEPAFLEDFGLPNTIFIILPDGTEIDLSVGSESKFNHIHYGPYRVLVDKKGVLKEAVFTWYEPTESEQVETLRRQIYWFWHDMSHFTKAMARGKLWWAYGQLEALRLYCINMARLRQNFLVRADEYEKLEEAVPIDRLSSLQETFCPMEQNAMLRATLVIVQFYRELAPSLARTHGIAYPDDLERTMNGRLEKLCDARLN